MALRTLMGLFVLSSVAQIFKAAAAVAGNCEKGAVCNSHSLLQHVQKPGTTTLVEDDDMPAVPVRAAKSKSKRKQKQEKPRKRPPAGHAPAGALLQKKFQQMPSARVAEDVDNTKHKVGTSMLQVNYRQKPSAKVVEDVESPEASRPDVAHALLQKSIKKQKTQELPNTKVSGLTVQKQVVDGHTKPAFDGDGNAKDSEALDEEIISADADVKASGSRPLQDQLPADEKEDAVPQEEVKSERMTTQAESTVDGAVRGLEMSTVPSPVAKSSELALLENAARVANTPIKSQDLDDLGPLAVQIDMPDKRSPEIYSSNQYNKGKEDDEEIQHPGVPCAKKTGCPRGR